MSEVPSKNRRERAQEEEEEEELLRKGLWPRVEKLRMPQSRLQMGK